MRRKKRERKEREKERKRTHLLLSKNELSCFTKEKTFQSLQHQRHKKRKSILILTHEAPKTLLRRNLRERYLVERLIGSGKWLCSIPHCVPKTKLLINCPVFFFSFPHTSPFESCCIMAASAFTVKEARSNHKNHFLEVLVHNEGKNFVITEGFVLKIKKKETIITSIGLKNGQLVILGSDLKVNSYCFH